MKKDLRFIAIASLLVATIISMTLGGVENRVSQVKNYPATACPGSLADSSVVDVMPNPKVLAASIPSKQGKMLPIGSRNFSTKKALLVDGGQITPVSVAKGSSGWLAAINCSVSDGDDWFVGGSANVTSKGVISVVNSGLSGAQVDFKVYSTKAPRTISKTIPANSEVDVMVDSLSPGEDSVAINAITRSGRVSIFMLDNQKRGLRSMGADFVASAPKPSNSLVIPNVPRVAKNKKTPQILRVVVPGSVDATLKATIYSSDGSFAPIGIDGVSVLGESVKDFVFLPIVADSSYSLKLESDVPISAAVLTIVGSDMVWATATPEITTTGLQIGGFKPLIRLYGKSIDVDLNWIDINGKRGSKRFVEKNTVAFRPKTGLARVIFTTRASGIYGALLIDNGSGAALLPITSGSHLESSVLPQSDARTINRG
jgi:6,7-dimethyl-8-ribityllumazine synthase